MSDVLGYAPVAAAIFAIPEFVPQILKLRATTDSAGVSWPWTWAAMLVTAGAVAGRPGLGVLLTAAFILQVTPSIWAAYRTARPSGVAAGTWLLILGELTCWLVFGLHASDVRLITLGCTGVTASVLMLARICWCRTTAARPVPAG